MQHRTPTVRRLRIECLEVRLALSLVADTIGGYDASSGVFFLRFSNTPGPADITFQFGPVHSEIVPLAGDWDGDGSDTIGLYDAQQGAFFLRNSNSAGPADFFVFGGGGRVPIVGDWDGDGIDTVGLYDPGHFGTVFLRNVNDEGVADITFSFGPGGAAFRPVTGDWDGDGDSTIGVYHTPTGTFFIKNTNASGPADSKFPFGPGGTGWQPLTGDWDNDMDDTIGAYDPAAGVYFLRNANAPGAADTTIGYGPVSGSWKPLEGAWADPTSIALHAPETTFSVEPASRGNDAPQSVLDEIEQSLGRALFVITTTVPERLDHAREVTLEELGTAEDLLEERADDLTNEQREELFEQLAAARTASDEGFDILGHVLEDAVSVVEFEFERILDLLSA